MSRALIIALAVLLVAFAVTLAGAPAPAPAHAATCADYADQAAAQAAADTRDADGDGLYCESLPCPCTIDSPDRTPPAPVSTTSPAPRSCTRPAGVQNITFSATKYPHIRQHFLKALRKHWPRTLVLNRTGADRRRARLLEDVPTKDGYDRDEYPPAIGRGKGLGLTKGTDPRGWRADVAYVPSAENRSHGSTMGLKLRRFCNGTKFRYVFY